ncbi:hypothetical protein HB825_11305 [Listeria booriae]|uniref:hypothetical protein n=1 Tax=Listeria booriae TaxID=1552123 RepID=UPI001624A7C0|nr:hypothetical protein [Listeria booriae]MBC2259294.1 hypothetical protein [Listeria booriae]MBC6135422.1 hypothetical protein [Listeria booriae]
MGAIINWLFSCSDEKVKMEVNIKILKEDDKKLSNRVFKLEKDRKISRRAD